jgi:hypothetical protein
MTLKHLIAAAALALGLAAALPATDARADVDVDIGFGVGVIGGGYGYRPGWGYGGYGGYRPRPQYYGYADDWYEEDYVTCRQGRKILYRFGYYDIETENCRAPNYKYIAWKKGRQFLIRVNTRGEINRISRVR